MDLIASWTRSCAAVGASGDVAGAGAQLVSAYGAHVRAYHDLRHLTEVLERVDELSAEAKDPDLVRLAAWFHDAVYHTETRVVGDNEERSAELATEMLRSLHVAEASREEVARLVRLTADHAPDPGDSNGAVLCDADLAVLARDPEGYADYAAAVRLEYAHVPDEAFRAGRSAILRSLLDQPQLFRTPAARQRWESTARANVTTELRDLEG
jgi:predicted metal-dependent HD superfamily phosphohydrolase